MKAIDLHCDTIGELYRLKKEGHPQSILKNSRMVNLEKMEAGDYGLQVFALFVNMERAEDPFACCMEMADLFYQELSAYPERIGIVRTSKEIEENWAKGRMSALLSIEEGGVCRGNPAFLRVFYRLGVRMMTLTWNYPNELGWPNLRVEKEDGSVSYQEDREHGLTEKGKEFVAAMEEMGMIIDVSHLNDAGIWDVFRLTQKPFVASHSNCRSLSPHPANLTDEMIRALGERGGVAGINFCSAFVGADPDRESETRMEELIRHMLHMKNIGGIGVVGLGSDFDGISNPVEMGDASGMQRLADAMKKAGFTSGEIEAVFYGNVLRLYREIL